MASTTVLQFDPLQTNCESDAAYLADSNRAGGFSTGAIWPSLIANKSLNQVSNYLFALFTAFAQKGFTTNDDNVPLLTAVCANFLTTADILPNIVSVASSPTPSFNAGASNGFQMTLTGNVTGSTISGLTPGQLIAFYFVQDGIGGRTVSFPASFVGAIQPDPAPSAVSLQMFRIDLAGIPRAVTPVVSNNGFFVPALVAASLAITGGVAAGTTLVGNGTILAPTAASFSAALDGYKVDVSTGIIEQWGFVATPSSGSSVTFPIKFPNACFNVQLCAVYPGSGNTAVVQIINSPTANGFSWLTGTVFPINGICSVYWRAIGN